MIRSNSAPRNSGSMANRPPVKRELAVTPGGQEGCQGVLVEIRLLGWVRKGGLERMWIGLSHHSLRPVSLRL